jgi:acyl-CoA reductase-like NAD-dependent aldehyde dehydrogenase
MAFQIQGFETLFIDGEPVSATGGQDPIINPATEEVIGLAPIAGRAEIEAAIGAARVAFDEGPWPRLTGDARAAVMQRFHDALSARAERIADIIRLEGGAVRADARARQFDLPMKHFRYFIELGRRDPARALSPVVTPIGGRKALGAAVVTRVPVGVVSAITAYNYPFFLNIGKIGPALMAGNTVVLKPSPYTPFQALVLADAAREAGLPPGVLNILNGGIDVGEAMTTDPRIDLVSFTGSDLVGARIAAQAAPTLKRLLLELGGKSAMIVRADGDQDMAAAAMLRGFTAHCGQGCGMFTRTLVHNSIRAPLVERVAEMARKVRVGDPADPATQMGPLIRASQRDRTERYVALGRDSGARLVTGGRRPAAFDRGFFYEPTLFDDVDNRSAVAQDEIFGPVGVVTGFDTDEEAIALANDAQFGLRSGIITADVGLAYEMAAALRTGHVTINNGALTSMSGVPLGGMKRSGYGREGGEEGFNAYTEVKAIEFHAG